MKSGLKYSLILILLVSLFLPTHFAHAGSWTTDKVVDFLLTSADVIVGNIAKAVLFFFVKIMAGLAGLAGLILNYVIKITIFDMRANLELLTGINDAWKVIKDLMNIGFIFMLIYQAILVIISKENWQSVRKFVFGIFLASILINFSLFFTKIIIDASNIVTVGIYNNIVPDDPANTVLTSGLANAYMRSLGMQTFYDPAGGITSNSVTGQAFGFLGMAILFLIVIFVFLAVSVMFVVRYIVLLALLALSPIAYMGLAWKGMEKNANKWWDSFWGQILWPPTYMIMTWVVLTIIRSPGFGATAGSFNNLMATDNGAASQGAASVIVNFALIIGMTIASLVISKQFATQGASQIGKFTSNATSFAGGALIGGAARLGRNTVGALGNRMAENEDLKKRAAEGSIRARLQLAAAERASKSTFDARATRAGKTTIGALLDKDTAFGKVDEKKDNFRAIRDARVKEQAERTKSYQPSDLAKEEAKRKLSDETLKEKERIERNKRQIYLNSEEYKNTIPGQEETKLRTDFNENNSQAQKLEAGVNEKREEIKRLRAQAVEEKTLKESAKQGESQENIALIDDQIRKLEESDEYKQKKLRLENQANELEAQNRPDETRLLTIREKIKPVAKQLEKYDKERNELKHGVWMSEERKNLVALAGGTSIKDEGKDGKVIIDAAGNRLSKVDETGQRHGSEISSAYTQRMQAIAEREENRPLWSRVGRGVVGKPLSAIGIINTPLGSGLSARNRRELARQIRKNSSGKTADQQLKELYEQKKKEAEALGDTTTWSVADSNTQTPAPAPAPTAPAPEPQNTGGGGGGNSGGGQTT